MTRLERDAAVNAVRQLRGGGSASDSKGRVLSGEGATNYMIARAGGG